MLNTSGHPLSFLTWIFYFFAALKAHHCNFLLDTFCTSGLPKHIDFFRLFPSWHPFYFWTEAFFFAALKAHYFNFLLDTFCTSGLPKHMGCEESSSYKCLSLLYGITNNLVINKFKAGIAPSLRLVVSAFPYFKLSKSASKWQNASSQCIEKSLSIFTGVSRYLPALLPGIYRELSIFTGIYRELSIFTGKYREMSHDIFSLDIFCHTG